MPPYNSVISSGKAWSQLPIQPSATASSLAPGMSFVAIQQLQIEQDAEHVRDKRSLLEIQEEEKALQQETEFLAWWTAEEERIKLEGESAQLPQGARPRQTSKRGGKMADQGTKQGKSKRHAGKSRSNQQTSSHP